VKDGVRLGRKARRLTKQVMRMVIRRGSGDMEEFRLFE
jgi:hypothetical protein